MCAPAKKRDTYKPNPKTTFGGIHDGKTLNYFDFVLGRHNDKNLTLNIQSKSDHSLSHQSRNLNYLFVSNRS